MGGVACGDDGGDGGSGAGGAATSGGGNGGNPVEGGAGAGGALAGGAPAGGGGVDGSGGTGGAAGGEGGEGGCGTGGGSADPLACAETHLSSLTGIVAGELEPSCSTGELLCCDGDMPTSPCGPVMFADFDFVFSEPSADQLSVEDRPSARATLSVMYQGSMCTLNVDTLDGDEPRIGMTFTLQQTQGACGDAVSVQAPAVTGLEEDDLEFSGPFVCSFAEREGAALRPAGGGEHRSGLPRRHQLRAVLRVRVCAAVAFGWSASASWMSSTSWKAHRSRAGGTE